MGHVLKIEFLLWPLRFHLGQGVASTVDVEGVCHEQAAGCMRCIAQQRLCRSAITGAYPPETRAASSTRDYRKGERRCEVLGAADGQLPSQAMIAVVKHTRRPSNPENHIGSCTEVCSGFRPKPPGTLRGAGHLGFRTRLALVPGGISRHSASRFWDILENAFQRFVIRHITLRAQVTSGGDIRKTGIGR